MGLCMSDSSSTKKEVKFSFKKEVHGLGPEYREKATDDENPIQIGSFQPSPATTKQVV